MPKIIFILLTIALAINSEAQTTANAYVSATIVHPVGFKTDWRNIDADNAHIQEDALSYIKIKGKENIFTVSFLSTPFTTSYSSKDGHLNNLTLTPSIINEVEVFILKADRSNETLVTGDLKPTTLIDVVIHFN